jgi:hypothetical protein
MWEDEMGAMCRYSEKDNKCILIPIRKPKGNRPLGRKDVDGKILIWCRLASCGSTAVVTSCGDGNEPSSSIKGGNFFTRCEIKLFKTDPTRSQFCGFLN